MPFGLVKGAAPGFRDAWGRMAPVRTSAPLRLGLCLSTLRLLGNACTED